MTRQYYRERFREMLGGIAGGTARKLMKSERVRNFYIRHNVDENYLLESIGFAIGKGIHLYLLENEILAEEQKELLRIFIDKYYGSENIFLSR